MKILIEFYMGTLYKKYCFRKDKRQILHNEYGPSYSDIESKLYFKNNILHNECGPAYICKGRKIYFLKNKEYDFEAWISSKYEKIIF